MHMVLEAYLSGLFPGPGKAYTAKEQAELLFELAGRKPKYISVPVALMDGIIGFLDFLARFIPSMEVRCWSSTSSYVAAVTAR